MAIRKAQPDDQDNAVHAGWRSIEQLRARLHAPLPKSSRPGDTDDSGEWRVARAEAESHEAYADRIRESRGAAVANREQRIAHHGSDQPWGTSPARVDTANKGEDRHVPWDEWRLYIENLARVSSAVAAADLNSGSVGIPFKANDSNAVVVPPETSALDLAAEGAFQSASHIDVWIQHIECTQRQDAEGQAKQNKADRKDDLLRARPFGLPCRDEPLTLDDLRVLYNLEELISRALLGELKGDTFLRDAAKLVKRCDEEEGLGVFPLKRIEEAQRRGGTRALLYRKLVDEVRAYKRQRKTRGAVESMLISVLTEALGPAAGVHLDAVAMVMGANWAKRRDIELMPTPDWKAWRVETFDEDPEKAVNAAFRAFGVSDVNQLASALRQ